MQKLLYYLALPVLYGLASLPFWALYGLSSGLYVLVYWVIGYRKAVVRMNLLRSFPEKTTPELLRLERNFYRYLCDLMVESLKMLTISSRTVLHRFAYPNVGLLDTYAAQGRSVIIVLGHHGNWELGAASMSLQAKHVFYGIYKRLRSPLFDNLFTSSRTRFGMRLVEMASTFRSMVGYKNVVGATAFIADQTPAPESAYWTTFMHQHTPVFWGTEKIARKFNYPVFYCSVMRLRRGYYEAHFELLEEHPASSPEGAISEAHTRRLEQDIRLQPETWLWSHRRWKHPQPAGRQLAVADDPQE